MERLEIGDRIEVVDPEEVLIYVKTGDRGTIKGYHRFAGYDFYCVEFDLPTRLGHDCEGLTKNGHYIPYNAVRKIEKILTIKEWKNEIANNKKVETFK